MYGITVTSFTKIKALQSIPEAVSLLIIMLSQATFVSNILNMCKAQ